VVFCRRKAVVPATLILEGICRVWRHLELVDVVSFYCKAQVGAGGCWYSPIRYKVVGGLRREDPVGTQALQSCQELAADIPACQLSC